MPTSQDISLQDLSILLEKRNEETHTCTLSAGRAQGTGIVQAPYPWQSLGGKNMPRVPGEMGIYSKWTYWASAVYQKTLTVDWLWQTCRDCFSHFGELWSRRGANQPRVHLPPSAGRGLQQRQSASQSQGHESRLPHWDSQTPGLAGRAGPGQPRTGSLARRRRVPALRGAALTRRASTRGWRLPRGCGCWGTPNPRDGWNHRG